MNNTCIRSILYIIVQYCSDQETLFHCSCRWYKKDENCFPASYILQPVTTWIPNYFNDNSPSLKQEAQKEWQREYNMMREFLQQAAKKEFEDKEHDLWHKYVRSGEILILFACN